MVSYVTWILNLHVAFWINHRSYSSVVVCMFILLDIYMQSRRLLVFSDCISIDYMSNPVNVWSILFTEMLKNFTDAHDCLHFFFNFSNIFWYSRKTENEKGSLVG